MSPLNALVFGLGLFFLGLRLVGEHLKALTGGSLRTGLSRTTQQPALRVGVGLAAGALMQSATAVTFICVSMVTAGLINTASAAAIIVWSNVGLTALAFIATLNIHPAVAFVVGGSGIVLGVVRVRSWQTVAGVLIGMGLILLGLQQMGEGAAPLRQEAWFQAGIASAIASPPLAFLAGTLAAAILQSNTGATMMVITLAGAIPFPAAALMIYGTNLGAIALRVLLAQGMEGTGLRLIRLEDLFCLASGLLLMALYYVEIAGIPLVLALSHQIAHTDQMALAVVFLLSNLLPAIVLTPFLPQCAKLLERVWPGEAVRAPGAPHFLSPQALDHPASALDLLRRELARLIGMTYLSSPVPVSENDEAPPVEFASLSQAIEDFTLEIASCPNLSASEIAILHRLRAALSGIRHLEEAGRFYAGRISVPGAVNADKKSRLDGVLADLLSSAASALDRLDAPKLEELAARSKKHGPFLHGLRQEVFPAGSSSLDASALYEDFELVTWTFHHLMEILSKLPDRVRFDTV